MLAHICIISFCGVLVCICCCVAIFTLQLNCDMGHYTGNEGEMMATIGKLSEFIPECESLTAYVERVELYFEANKIEEGRKVSVFLSVLGSKTYSVLRDFLAPFKPKDKKFSKLVDALTRHFEPRPIVIAERFRFHKRDQKQGELPLAHLAPSWKRC